MKTKNLITLLSSIGIFFICIHYGYSQEQKSEFSGKTISLQSTDNIELKADIYEARDENSPIILLFHQAGYSRGEYRPIAPKLNELGFSCIAIDQRSGNEVNGIKNEAFLQAKKQELGTHYTDAFPDLETLIDYAKTNYKGRKLILWGSSYSASLVFVLGNKYKNDISAIVSFSPGEYFTWQDKEIKEYAKNIVVPVFVSSSGKEFELSNPIFEVVPSNNKTYFFPDFEGKHGSSALWETTDGHEKYWTALTAFLKLIK
jgi:pimeloyl-ACP methyl ester carboxylesterase